MKYVATHKNPKTNVLLMKEEGIWYLIMGFGTKRVPSGKTLEWNDTHLIKLVEEWSIYNNELPFDKLNDEQRGLLFNHWFKDKNSIEFATEGLSKFESTHNIIWDSTVVYRAKVKTKLALYIESFEGINLTGTRSEIIETLYKAGYAAPKKAHT